MPARSSSIRRSKSPSTPPSRIRPSSTSSPARPSRSRTRSRASSRKSANDAAVVIAENLGGDETSFAKLMTQKAHALGMSAHDLCQCVRPARRRSDHHRARPGAARAARSRTASRAITNISRPIPSSITAKRSAITTICSAPSTASTASRPDLPAPPASISSPRCIATGATSSPSSWAAPRPAERDARMRELISEHIKEAALQRTAPMIAEPASTMKPQPVAFAKAPMARWRSRHADTGADRERRHPCGERPTIRSGRFW